MSYLRKISISPAGDASWAVLADEAAGEYIAGGPPHMRGLAQVEPLYGSQSPFVADQGNRTWTWTFVVMREHADAEAAAAFLASHPADISGLLDVQMIQGSTTTVMTDAVLTAYEPDEPTGRSTNIRYQFTGATYS